MATPSTRISGGNLSTPIGEAPIIPLTALGIGLYLFWYTVHYWKQGGWPTTPVRSILQGSGVPAPAAKGPSTSADLAGIDTATNTAVSQISTATASSSAPPAAAGTGTTASQYTQVATFTQATLEALWTSNGGAASAANNAACHAMQESGGRPTAVNVGGPGPGCNAVGLWQLATPCGKGAGYTQAQLEDPVTNARITIMATRNGTDWSAWATSGC
jgi:hypothetical protein